MADELVTLIIGMIGVAIGGIVTYIANKKLQDRIRKYEIAREVYAPILSKLGQAEIYDLNQLEHRFYLQKWEELRKNPLFYWIDPEINKRLYSFQVNLHNFNVGLLVSRNKINELLKDEIFKMIKEEKIDKLQRTQPLVSGDFLNDFAKIVLQSKEIGFLGGIGNYLRIEEGYKGLEKDFKVVMSFHDFVKSIALRFKDDSLLSQVKVEQEKVLGECQTLQKEIRKKMGLKIERWD